MMKKGLKVLSTALLISSLAFAGCGKDKKEVARFENADNKILSNLSSEAADYSMLDVYNALVEKDEYATAANKLVDYVAENVLELSSSTNVWKQRYEDLVKETLEGIASSSEYKVNGTFDEAYFVQSLKAKGYNVSCPAEVTYGTPDALACNYNDYVEKSLKHDILVTLLKQKYVLDVTLDERKTVLTTKKIRNVEYFSISNSMDGSYDELNTRDFMLELRNKIANNEVVDFETIEDELKQTLKDKVTENYNKIGTSDDYTQSLFSEYTKQYTQDKSVGYATKLQEVDDYGFADKVWIDSDSGSSSVISESITSILLSVSDPTSETYARKVIAIKDANDETYYYLVSPNAGQNIDEKDVLISESDGSNYVYSIVRFRVVNSDTTDESDIYEAAKLIASNSSLANNAVVHYLKENKDTITVYDDDFYSYLNQLYPETFTEEK